VDVLPKIPVNSPILCLLGDIGYPDSEVYQNYLLEHADRFEHVIVVAGNHEYYKQESFQQANKQIEEICKKRSNLHFLNQSTWEFGDVTFIGCTLWPNLPVKNLRVFGFAVNDYHMIFVEQEDGTKKKLTPEATNIWHFQQVDWIVKTVEEIRLAKPEQKVVVLTHHAPSSFECLWPETRGTEMAFMQYDELEHLMKTPMVVWAFGHTHHNSDYIRGEGVRVVSNQCGYILLEKKPSDGYDPGKVICLSETEDMVARWMVEEEQRQQEQNNQQSLFAGWNCSQS